MLNFMLNSYYFVFKLGIKHYGIKYGVKHGIKHYIIKYYDIQNALVLLKNVTNVYQICYNNITIFCYK